jgi:SAM-dependent methyltransferase
VSASLVYRSAWLYELAMLVLYGRHYHARYHAVAELIPPRASVLELCCGPGILFERYLRKKGVDYTGLDVNPHFVARVKRCGGNSVVVDLRQDEPLPVADYVIMQASLYHFLPDAAPIVRRMRAAAQEGVVIAEPIRNWATSGNRVLAALANRHTDPGLGTYPQRFTEPMLDALFSALSIEPHRSFSIPGGREKVYLIDGQHLREERAAG